MNISSIHQLVVRWSNGDEYVVDDSFVVEGSKGLIQILNDYNKIYVFNIVSAASAKILGDFDLTGVEIYLRKIKDIEGAGPIQSIHNYTHAPTYFFGTKFLSEGNAFILGFCHGWDEIVCLSAPEFESLLSTYEPHQVSVIAAAP